jgi:hypothetical protein
VALGVLQLLVRDLRDLADQTESMLQMLLHPDRRSALSSPWKNARVSFSLPVFFPQAGFGFASPGLSATFPPGAEFCILITIYRKLYYLAYILILQRTQILTIAQ